MAKLVSDCPRCGAKQITFDVHAHQWVEHLIYEMFSICRSCQKSTIFIVRDQCNGGYDNPEINWELVYNNNLGLNQELVVLTFVSQKNNVTVIPPEHLPKNIEDAFTEGVTCMSVNCYNAAGTMFRLCLDFATKQVLPDVSEGLNSHGRRSLGLRLNWLIEQNILPESLSELADCIKEDGNDGAHEGTLFKDDADDILDFTMLLLERIYTEPKRLELAKERRLERKKDNK